MAKSMSAMEKPVYRFGEFELDPDERRLLAHGEPVTLTPKVFDTLVLLVEHAGHAVSKDALMTALWPRGFVDESNLTKHIWLIRKALGDDRHDACGVDEARCIETVPKLGYRFVAPVQQMARADVVVDGALQTASTPVSSLHSSASAEGASQPPPLTKSEAARTADGAEDRRVLVPTEAASSALTRWVPGLRQVSIVLAILAVVAIAVLSWQHFAREEALSSGEPPGTAVAIVAFNNLSQNAKDAWLGPALGEMLATEITASGRLHAMPDELVRPARTGLPAPLAGGYAARSLATLRERLGTDYVLSGSYLVSGAGDDAKLHLDLALQDARTGVAVATLVRNSTVVELPALVTGAGTELREHLGVAPANRDELQRIASAQPPSAEVARRIGFALDALQRNDPARARDELLDAVAQAPGYAPAYSYLAQAWSALGYKAKALAAAQQAAAHAQGLPEEQRLQIDAQVHTAQHDWDHAATTDRALVKLRPQDPEYRFQLIATLVAGGKPDEAQAELTTALKELHGPILDDPRMELEQARVAFARSDNKQLAAHAEHALQQARQRDETGVAAEAATQLGIARWRLGDLAGAEKVLKQARADYTRVDNPHGEAWVDQNLANVYADSNPARAREVYQRALAGYQAIGDRNGEAAIYSDLGIMLWSAGDHDGTETAIRKSLAIRRETADLVGQAWNLAALASVETDSAASNEAANDYRAAVALDEQAGERVHRAFTLMQYSDLQRLRGDLQAANTLCAQALDGYRDAGDAGGIAAARFQCAQVALDRGDIEAAEAGAGQARTGATPSGDSITLGDVDLLLAQIAVGQGDCNAAISHLEDAVKTFVAGEMITGEATAQAKLAVCYQALGRDAERDRALARARQLRTRITEHQEVFSVDIALAQLSGETGQEEAAVATLRDLIADADKRQWLAWSLESRLALTRLLERHRDPAADALRNALEKDARSHGFGWILAQLGAAPA